MPRIQPFFGLKRHITCSAQTRAAQGWPGHVTLAATSAGAGVDRRTEPVRGPIAESMSQPAAMPLKEDATLVGFRRTLEPEGLCGVRPMVDSRERPVAPTNAT